MDVLASISKFKAEHGRAFACIVAFAVGLIVGAVLF